MKSTINDVRIDRIAVFTPGQPVKKQFQIALSGAYIENVFSIEEIIVLRDLLNRAIEEEHKEEGGER